MGGHAVEAHEQQCLSGLAAGLCGGLVIEGQLGQAMHRVDAEAREGELGLDISEHAHRRDRPAGLESAGPFREPRLVPARRGREIGHVLGPAEQGLEQPALGVGRGRVVMHGSHRQGTGRGVCAHKRCAGGRSGAGPDHS